MHPVDRQTMRPYAGRHRPMRVGHVLRRFHAHDFIFLGTVDVELSIVTGVSELQPTAAIDGGDHLVSLRINHGQLAGITIDHENMAARWIKDDAVSIALRSDPFDDL